MQHEGLQQTDICQLFTHLEISLDIVDYKFPNSQVFKTSKPLIFQELKIKIIAFSYYFIFYILLKLNKKKFNYIINIV